MNELKIIELDYLQDSSVVYDYVHNKEWPIYLCSNNHIFSEHKYDIITASPKEKIFFSDDKTTIESKGVKRVSTEEPIPFFS